MTVDRIDSNQTGLRYAQEASLKTLPGSPVWKQFEPNSYGDFGATVGKTRRNPINADRSNKKGVTTDLDASASFNQDLTCDNTFDVLQGFFFADAREKPTTAALNGAAAMTIPITSVSGTQFLAASGLTIFKLGAIVRGFNFAVAANNGNHDVTVVAAGAVTASGCAVEASPPASSYMETIGHKAGSAELDIVMTGSIPKLNRASGTLDFTTLSLSVGEWIYLGDDTAGNRFTNNQGFARISVIAATALTFDKTTFAAVNETGTAKTIAFYYGKLIQNELAALIKRRSYQLERTLGNDGTGVQSEYVTGSVPNEWNLSIPRADKVSEDLSFVGCDSEYRTGATGVKSGSRPTLPSSAALNTTSDMVRMRLGLVDTTTSIVTPLFAYVEEISLKVSNGVSGEKAIGTLGNFDTVSSNFDVSGSIQAFFAATTAVLAVRNNSDVTLDIIMIETQRGILIDIPLIQMGNGKITVEQDKSIRLPLDTMAAQSVAGPTMVVQQFSWLPLLAG